MHFKENKEEEKCEYKKFGKAEKLGGKYRRRGNRKEEVDIYDE